jgi:hypothetical protein
MPPQPGTAVNEAARSIVSRMNRILSRALASIATGLPPGCRESKGFMDEA